MVNLLCVNDRLIVADPFFAPFQNDFITKLKKNGYAYNAQNEKDIRFIDAWIYHMSEGEVHCATNARRLTTVKNWWEKLEE